MILIRTFGIIQHLRLDLHKDKSGRRPMRRALPFYYRHFGEEPETRTEAACKIAWLRPAFGYGIVSAMPWYVYSLTLRYSVSGRA